MEGGGIITLVGSLILLPFALLRDLFRLGRRWQRVPLPQRNTARALVGAFALAACAVLAAHGFPVIGWHATAAIAAFAALWLGVGIHGARGASFDAMAALWWLLLALGGAGLLAVRLAGWPL